MFWKMFCRIDQQAEKNKAERVLGLIRRTREEIVKWNQMTALRFQTGGETSDIPGLPSGGVVVVVIFFFNPMSSYKKPSQSNWDVV